MDVIFRINSILGYCMKKSYTPAGVSIKGVIQNGGEPQKKRTNDF